MARKQIAHISHSSKDKHSSWAQVYNKSTTKSILLNTKYSKPSFQQDPMSSITNGAKRAWAGDASQKDQPGQEEQPPPKPAEVQVILGTGNFGSPLDPLVKNFYTVPAAQSCLDLARSFGITRLDTARLYSPNVPGTCEPLLGQTDFGEWAKIDSKPPQHGNQLLLRPPRDGVVMPLIHRRNNPPLLSSTEPHHLLHFLRRKVADAKLFKFTRPVSVVHGAALLPPGDGSVWTVEVVHLCFLDAQQGE